MTLYEAINTHVSADSTLITGLTGGVSPDTIPQNTLVPVMVVRRISGDGFSSLEGPMSDSRIRIELTIWGGISATNERLVNRLRKIFNFDGLLGGVNGVRFQVVKFSGPRSVYDQVTRMRGMQLDILGLIDEDTIS